MNDAARSHHAPFELSVAGCSEPLEVLSFEATESLCKLFRVELRLWTTSHDDGLAASLTEQAASLFLLQGGDKELAGTVKDNPPTGVPFFDDNT